MALATLIETADAANEWHRRLASRSAAEKLALIDISLPWLRRMGRDEASEFLQLNRALIAADGEVCLFEFMLAAADAIGASVPPLSSVGDEW